MKRFLFVILFLLSSAFTCNKKVKVNDINTAISEYTMVVVEDTLTKHQLDSVFIADTISFNIENDWVVSQVLDENKNEYLYKYVYIKELTDSTGTIYVLCSYQDTLYILNKRIVK